MIEANKLHEATLDRLAMMNGDRYLITALGDEEREVIFYTRSDKPHTEGNSYYKERREKDPVAVVRGSKGGRPRLYVV